MGRDMGRGKSIVRTIIIHEEGIMARRASEQAQQERQDKLDALMGRLERELVGLTNDPAAWKRWLDGQAKFHKYSFGNCLMILFQRPDATVVAGYRRWQELGRQVRAGERGITIMMPRLVKDRNDPDGSKILAGFMGGTVFDIAQTDGEPIGADRELQTNDNVRLLDALTELVVHDGLSVEREDLGMAQGMTDGKRIVLRDGMAIDMQASVMAHELAHVRLHHIGDHDVPTNVKELEAESVSYVVCQALGLDTGSAAIPYLGVWTGITPENKDEVVGQLKACTARIAGTAKKILEEIESAMGQNEEMAA